MENLKQITYVPNKMPNPFGNKSLGRDSKVRGIRIPRWCRHLETLTEPRRSKRLTNSLFARVDLYNFRTLLTLHLTTPHEFTMALRRLDFFASVVAASAAQEVAAARAQCGLMAFSAVGAEDA